ncbi:FecR family protein [uncultured Bacteroides sp.]|uniref:FecR family protein n=1 Tax=uncultured Bacteroides sp. TaxID=162156 RepID=UPI002675303C|nr:FecR family protein [uncultured Bacteroides sp.]
MKKTERIYKLFLYISEKRMISPSARLHLQRWLINTQDILEKDEALFLLWGKFADDIVSEEKMYRALHIAKLNAGISEYKRILPIHIFYKCVAVLFVAFLIGWLMWSVRKDEFVMPIEMIECYVPYGRRDTVRLSDGSEVFVNSGSLFVYPQHFIGDKRQVYLSGEAYFKVVRDEKLPFIVHAGMLDVKVLGTNFNVESYPDCNKITATLMKGTIKVYPYGCEEGCIMMKPNDHLVYCISDENFYLYQTDPQEYMAWIYGELYFNRQSLSSILKKIERHYDVLFVYDDNINLSEIYTMKFGKNETIEEVMEVLTLLIGNITLYKDDNTIFLERKGGVGNK